jgi:hypothetical protein
MKCRYKKTNKESCKNNSLKNDKYCYWHSKKITEAEKNMNRSNGGKQKQIKCNTEFVEFEIESIKGVCKLNATLINAVLKNKIDLKIATGICYMLNLQMKAIELEQAQSKTNNMPDVYITLPEAFEKVSKEMEENL